MNYVVSRYNGVKHFIRKIIDCNSKSVIYYILCPCGNIADYVGSTGNMKRRWSKHKHDIRNSNWTACGLTRHFGDHHTGGIEAALSLLQVVLLDQCEREADLKKMRVFGFTILVHFFGTKYSQLSYFRNVCMA